MRGLVVALVLGLVLAGCIRGGDDAPADNDTLQAAAVLPANATVAPDGRGAISAFNETNATETGVGGMIHDHDYWGGKERLDDVAWIDSGLIPLPLAPCKKPDGSCTLGSTMPSPLSGDTYPFATAIADYDLDAAPAMGMVYEGTKQVELKMVSFDSLMKGTPPNPLGKVYFDYLAANDPPGKFRQGGELKLNEPFLIEIQPTDADMPHQTKSLWIFRIYSNSEMITFGFNITISLIKGYDVVNWPPHPDLYANGPTRLVFEGPVKLASKGSVDGLMFGSDAGWLHPERVISWGTERVDVELTNVRFTPGIPVAPPPTGFALEYRNASTYFLMGNGLPYSEQLKDASSDGTSYAFTIDLTEDRGDAMDTPYASFSRWGFRLVPYWEDAATCISTLRDCQWYPWEMTYDMKVVATGKSTAGGAPDGSG